MDAAAALLLTGWCCFLLGYLVRWFQEVLEDDNILPFEEKKK